MYVHISLICEKPGVNTCMSSACLRHVKLSYRSTSTMIYLFFIHNDDTHSTVKKQHTLLFNKMLDIDINVITLTLQLHRIR